MYFIYIFEYTKHKRVEISQALISGTFIQPHYPLALPPSNSYTSLWDGGQMKEHVPVVTLFEMRQFLQHQNVLEKLFGRCTGADIGDA